MLSESQKSFVFVICLLVLVSAVLVGVGAALKSDWGSFVPDVLIGIVGASIIAIAVYHASEKAATRRILAADISAAYNRLLDDLTPLRGFDFRRNDLALFSTVVTRMIQLADAKDDDDMRVWFEAERQRALHKVGLVMKAVDALPQGATAQQVFDANRPFNEWVAEFSQNVRFWRVNNGRLKDMLPHAALIEKELRGKNLWIENAIQWEPSP